MNMADRVLSPDGKWMWTGSEWIPAPPTSVTGAQSNLNLADSMMSGNVNIEQDSTVASSSINLKDSVMSGDINITQNSPEDIAEALKKVFADMKFNIQKNSEESKTMEDSSPLAECAYCRAIIPANSGQCPHCHTKFSGLADEPLGECPSCKALITLTSMKCPRCGVFFIADLVLDTIRSWVKNDEINLRNLFSHFDANGDGIIDHRELRNGLSALNLADLSPSQVTKLFEEIDVDKKGLIDLQDFRRSLGV
jgi:RNA polymerase subunit RPABC4/transcription elongation factor Spt4